MDDYKVIGVNLDKRAVKISICGRGAFWTNISDNNVVYWDKSIFIAPEYYNDVKQLIRDAFMDAFYSRDE